MHGSPPDRVGAAPGARHGAGELGRRPRSGSSRGRLPRQGVGVLGTGAAGTGRPGSCGRGPVAAQAGIRRTSRWNAGDPQGDSARGEAGACRPAQQLSLRGEPSALRSQGGNDRRVDTGASRRNRSGPAGSVRPVGAGTPAVDLRFSRRTHHGLGIPLVPARASGPVPRARPRRHGQRGLRQLPRMARAGGESGRTGGDSRPLPDGAATRATQFAARGHLSSGDAGRSLGGARPGRLAFGNRTLGRIALHPVVGSSGGHRLPDANGLLIPRGHPRDRPDHRRVSRHGRPRRADPQLSGHPGGRRRGARGAGQPGSGRDLARGGGGAGGRLRAGTACSGMVCRRGCRAPNRLLPARPFQPARGGTVDRCGDRGTLGHRRPKYGGGGRPPPGMDGNAGRVASPDRPGASRLA